MFSRFVYTVAHARIFFLFKAKYCSIAHGHRILFIHSFVSGVLSCFCHLVVVNDSAVNIGVQIYLVQLFQYLRAISLPKSEITESQILYYTRRQVSHFLLCDWCDRANS